MNFEIPFLKMDVGGPGKSLFHFVVSTPKSGGHWLQSSFIFWLCNLKFPRDEGNFLVNGGNFSL